MSTPANIDHPMGTAEKTAVYLSVVVGGAVLMALEVAGFRIIGRSFGSALRETTTVISVFLVAMSVGYAAGGRIGDRWPRLTTLLFILVAASASLLLIPQVDSTFTPKIGAVGNQSMHAFFAAAILFAVPTLLLAMVSPLAIRLFARDPIHVGRIAGGISALSTIGSVLGSVTTAFFLIDWLGSIARTVTLLGTITAAIAVLLAFATTFARGHPRPRYAVSLAVIGMSFALIGSCTFYPMMVVPERLTTEGTRVLFDRDSPYHHVRVLDRPAGERDLLIDSTLQSRMYRNDPHVRGLEYEEYVHLARLIRPSLRRVLLIGLGGGTVAKQFTKYYPDTLVDAVEIDPLIVTAAERFFEVRRSERVRLHTGDGRAFLRSQREQYDLISIDAYTRGRYGSTIPPHLVTREFFNEVAQHLTPGGLVHFHSYGGRGNKFTRSLYRTMTSVFPTVITFGETEFVASNTPIQIDASDLIARAGSIRAHIPEIDARIRTMNQPAPDTSGMTILTDDYSPVDTLLRGQ